MKPIEIFKHAIQKLLLLWQYILMDAIQKASQTWGGKRNPGALNGKTTET